MARKRRIVCTLGHTITGEGRKRICETCRKGYYKRWYKATGKHRESTWKRLGIALTKKEYDLMCAAQNGLCAICQKPQETFSVDHNHQTGRVRALLCTNCNTMLGMSGDNPDRLRLGAAYLTSFGG